MTDVGGNRVERKKWVQFFDDVNTVLFLASLAEYDETNTTEDDEFLGQLKMERSLKIFQSLTESPVYQNVIFLLFLNKLDIFEEKLPRFPLSNSYPQFKGESDVKSGCEFLVGKFRRAAREARAFYHHFTTATDTKNVNTVFNVSVNFIIKTNLTGSGMH